MSYFAKPNFIIYDEWFDDDLEKTKLDNINTKIENISTIHEFFYKQSNYKIGASENNFKLDIKVDDKKLFNNNYLVNTSENLTSISNKKFRLFKKPSKSKLKFNIPKKLIYSLSFFSFIFIFGFLIFFSQSEQNELEISNRFLILERQF